MARVLLADDHPLFRAALMAAVRRAAPEAEALEAASLAAALAALDSPDADVSLVLLDLKMADCEGFAGLLALRSRHPATAVAVVSGSEDVETMRKALAFGAAGFIPKSAGLEEMSEALRAILAGDGWAPACAADLAFEGGDDMPARIASLTPAQLRILIGLQKGRLNKQIAFEMGVTEATVKAHMTAIFRKLGVLNRTQAVIAAQAMELAPAE